jgi:hypothetical protein
MIKYYLCFNDNYFKDAKMFYIGMKDFEKKDDSYWCLTESAPLDLLPINEVLVDIKNRFEISRYLFYKIKNLSSSKKSYILRYDSPIELFKAWDLLKYAEEYLI